MKRMVLATPLRRVTVICAQIADLILDWIDGNVSPGATGTPVATPETRP